MYMAVSPYICASRIAVSQSNLGCEMMSYKMTDSWLVLNAEFGKNYRLSAFRRQILLAKSQEIFQCHTELLYTFI